MPIEFDVSTAGGYIRSFTALHQHLKVRSKGKILELNVTVPQNRPVPKHLTIFMEARSLYIVAFRAAATIVVLDLGYHLKTGHALSLQNRPTEAPPRTKICCTLPAIVPAMFF
jgi:hypothetical protein